MHNAGEPSRVQNNKKQGKQAVTVLGYAFRRPIHPTEWIISAKPIVKPIVKCQSTFTVLDQNSSGRFILQNAKHRRNLALRK